MSRRVLLLLPQQSYRGEDFLAAAERLGVEVLVASDRCQRLAAHWGVPMAVRFDDASEAERTILQECRNRPVDAVVATDDASTLVASRVARRLRLRANGPEAVWAARNKARMRGLLRAAGLPQPRFAVLEEQADRTELDRVAADIGLPCVVKPLLMSGSRGVICAREPASFHEAFARVRAILHAPDVRPGSDPAARQILVEEFVPGPEVALEGLLGEGARLEVLAIFDKPDPLDGPLFEETLYVTPSRLPRAVQSAIGQAAAAAARALGLAHGPIHAELRLSPRGPVAIEVAARSIGGLCARTLRFGTGHTLEELILADALGLPSPASRREPTPAGVLMLPIPRRGLLREIKGVEAAKTLEDIEAVEITAPLDHEIVPLPEGSAYLGFVFARAATPERVEAALRRAGELIQPVIRPDLALPRPRPA